MVAVVGFGVGAADSILVGSSISVSLAALAARRRSPVIGGLALVPCGAVVGVPWPGPTLAAAAVIYWIVRPGQSPNDLTGGPCKRALVTLVLSGLCAAAAAQIVESSIARPVVVQMGEPPIPLLVVGILAVAAVNSLGEELLWRGVLHDWLTCSVRMPTTVLATSASFGAAHLAGIPEVRAVSSLLPAWASCSVWPG